MISKGFFNMKCKNPKNLEILNNIYNSVKYINILILIHGIINIKIKMKNLKN